MAKLKKKYVITIELESEYISSEDMNDTLDRVEEMFECNGDYDNGHFDWHVKEGGYKKEEV